MNLIGRGLLLCWLLAAASLAALPAAVAADLSFPALDGRVVDQAGILSPAIRAKLTEMLARHEAETSNQVVVVTLKSLQGVEIEDFGYQLGRHWGIGRKERNNGLLFIVAPNERQVRIEVGYGLEGVMTDALSHYIIQNAILPAFRKGDFETGVLAGTAAILAGLQGSYQPMPEQTTAGDWLGALPVLVIIGIFVLVFYYRFAAPAVRHLQYDRSIGRPGEPGYRPPRGGVSAWSLFFLQLVFQILFSLLLSGGRGSGGSFGSGSGGSFSGGGGSFGGGGASGRW